MFPLWKVIGLSTPEALLLPLVGLGHVVVEALEGVAGLPHHPPDLLDLLDQPLAVLSRSSTKSPMAVDARVADQGLDILLPLRQAVELVADLAELLGALRQQVVVDLQVRPLDTFAPPQRSAVDGLDLLDVHVLCGLEGAVGQVALRAAGALPGDLPGDRCVELVRLPAARAQVGDAAWRNLPASPFVYGMPIEPSSLISQSPEAG